MWVKDLDSSSDSFIHVCEGKTVEHMRFRNKQEIRKNDITVFSILWKEKGTPEINYITFCPYCGVNLLKTN